MKNKSFVLNQYEGAKISTCRLGDNVVLMCPNCYTIYHIKQSGYMNAMSSTDIDLLVSPMYHIQCGKCGSNETAIILEPPIAFAVSGLNKLGYLTEMSCCGHEGDSNCAFIKFKEEYKFDSLPDCWYLNGVFLRASYLNHKEEISYLNKWVKSLKNK